MSWKSTGSPVKLSIGPCAVSALEGARNVVCGHAHIAAPFGPTNKLTPDVGEIFPLSTIVPSGRTLGRCWLSTPTLGPSEPTKLTSPVEIGYARPDCS